MDIVEVLEEIWRLVGVTKGVIAQRSLSHMFLLVFFL
jgi:hypothetical protein